MSSLPVKLAVAAAVVLGLLAATSLNTAYADAKAPGPRPKQPAVRLPFGVVSQPGRAQRGAAHGDWLETLRRTGALPDVAVKLFSDVAAELLSDNQAQLFSGNAPELLSGNAPELLSGNEAELLSGNKTELLSGNEAELNSGNTAEILSGNNFEFLSNIVLEVSIQNCGNNNGKPLPGRMGGPVPTIRKRPAGRGSLSADQSGTLRLQEISRPNADEDLQRAMRRFKAMDKNGDGVLDFEEYSSPRPTASPQT
jgi:hypothetical protein